MQEIPSSLTRRQHLSLLGGLGLAVMAGSLTGCFRKAEAGGVRLWHTWDPHVYPSMGEVLEQFRRRNPDLTLQDEVIPSPFLKAKLASALASGHLADVVILNSSWIGKLGEGNAFVDLFPFVAADGIDLVQRLRPNDLSRCRQGGMLPCLPATSASGTSMLFTNEVIREQSGLAPGLRYGNWAEFTKVSADVVRRLNPGRTLEYIALDPFFSPGLQIHSSLAAGLGSMPVSLDGRVAQLMSAESLEVARALDDYVEEVYGPYGGYRGLMQWRTQYMAINRVSNFVAIPFGRQVFCVAAAGAIASYRRIMNPLQLSIQPVPGLRRLHGGVATPTWAYAISRKARDPMAAWRLVRHLTLEESGVGQFCRAFFRASPLPAFDESTYKETLGALWDGAKEAMALDVTYPVSMMDEILRDQYYSVPMRRLRGEGVSAVMGLMNHRLQTYIDGDDSRLA